MTNTRSEHHSRIHRDPEFGWNSWINQATRPADTQVVESVRIGRTFSGADTIGGDIGLLPDNLDMYASYVDNYGGWNELVAARETSGGFLLSITIFGGAAHCADVQPGAMAASHLPNWLDNIALKTTGFTPDVPWVYTSASGMSTANRYIGSRHVVRWSAHYGFGPHVCGPRTCGWPQADWTQWDDKGARGQNIDRSIGFVLPTAIPEKPSHASGVARFSGKINLDTGEWTIQGEPGKVHKWGTKNVRWSAAIQVDGSNGTWDAKGLDFNADIPTTGSKAMGNPASGTARFAGSIDFDKGVWDIYGTPGNSTWGDKEQWSAVVKIDNRDGTWNIVGSPFNSPPMGA